MDRNVREPLLTIWNYMKLDMPLRKCDCIVGFGCYNDDIPLRCAQLYAAGWAPKILFTGGLGRNTRDLWTEGEAQRFAAIAREAGVPEKDIILEPRATNSAENILFTREKLRELGMEVSSILAVHKPFMERRLMAAMGVYWPEIDAVYTSPQLTLEEYIDRSVAQGMTEKGVIDVMVGDFQRMDVYEKKGYQIHQEIPEEVWQAFYTLVDMGYTGELVEPV